MIATGNTDLHSARKGRNDEFYTQLSDIENEMRHYWPHFRDKTIYCNCDDPKVSNFYKYFSMQFHNLEMRKLIASCYRNSSPDLFSAMNDQRERAIWLEYNGETKDNRPMEPEINHFRGDGDFRNAENIELLNRVDIVITNPPFSLWREYVLQLIEYGKKFIILGNMNAVTCKNIFPLIRDNRMWYGPSISSGDREFGVPDDYPLTAANSRMDENGNRFVSVKGVRWFTNLHHGRRNENLLLYKTYNPQDYPEYDNYDAINVDRTGDIPVDYPCVMGVPITFLDKYNPEQFEILGIDTDMIEALTGRRSRFILNGKMKYARIIIRNRNPQ